MPFFIVGFSFRLILVAFLAYKVSSTEASQQHEATAQRSRLVALLSVARKARSTAAKTTIRSSSAFLLLGGFSTLEQTTVVSEGRHAQSEDDCDCQC